MPAGLLILCRGSAANQAASAVSTCERRITTPTTIYVAAGHMHLLGSSIRLELNPGTSRAKVLLDIPRWDFHWQGQWLYQEPIAVRAAEKSRISGTPDVNLRRLPRARSGVGIEAGREPCHAVVHGQNGGPPS